MHNIIQIAVLVYLIGVVFNLYLFNLVINEDSKIKNEIQDQGSAGIFVVLKIGFMSWGVYLRAIFLQVKED